MELEKTETETATKKETTPTTANGELRNRTLTERMIKLMAHIAEHNYLSIREIGLIYSNQTYAYKVLGTLKEMRLVGQFKTTLKPRKAYYLRPKGYRTLEKYGALRLRRRFLPQHYKPFIFTHRLASARVGLILKAHPLIRNFLPESLLWERRESDREKICDGEFLYLAPGAPRPQRVGLEVELSLKNRERLVNSFRDLVARRDLHEVWWLCGDRTIFRALMGLADFLPWLGSQRHRFVMLEEFEKAGRKLELSDCRGVVRAIDAPERVEPELPQYRPEPPSPAPMPPSRPARLPIMVAPGEWGFAPTPRREPWHWYAGWVFLAASIVALLYIAMPNVLRGNLLSLPPVSEEVVK